MKKIYRHYFFVFFAFLLFFGINTPKQVEAAKSYSDKVKISTKDPAVVMRVSYATCKFNDGYGGTFAAAPVKDTPTYHLYDVVIWEDRINLYKFDNDYEKKLASATEGFATEKESMRAYIKARESYCLKSVRCKKGTEPITKSTSNTIKKAYISFFKIMKKKTPSRLIALKHSGHSGNGMLFNSLNYDDTIYVLKQGVKIFGHKFALLDYGSNCRTSNTMYFDIYGPYFDYMVASQQDVGGWIPDSMDAYDKLDLDLHYDEMFHLGMKMPDAAKRIALQMSKYWTCGRKDIKKHKVKQSITVLNMKNYSSLMKSLQKNRRYRYSPDLYTAVKRCKSSSLTKKYKSFVIYYKDNNNKTYFKWKTKNYGVDL